MPNLKPRVKPITDRTHHRSFWFAVSVIILLPWVRVLAVSHLGPSVIVGLIFFILLPLVWLYALGWTLRVLFSSYGTQEGWWRISIPYSLLFLLIVLVSGGRIGLWFHLVSEPFLLYYATSLAATAWTLVTAIRLGITHTLSRTPTTQIRLFLGAVASTGWIVVLLLAK